MASAASARFASVSTEQIEKIVQDKDSENLKILNNKRIIEFGLCNIGYQNYSDLGQRYLSQLRFGR
jgi:hypothetical protein